MARGGRIALLLLLAGIAAGAWNARNAGPLDAHAPPVSTPGSSLGGEGTGPRALPDGLPVEVEDTLRAIESGGPFRYDRDGAVFQNREGRLPARPRGHYREYTVVTRGSRDRGARRIVTGGDPPTEWYYTDDHYRSFRRIDDGAPR
jgi:ribonuclease T1